LFFLSSCSQNRELPVSGGLYSDETAPAVSPETETDADDAETAPVIKNEQDDGEDTILPVVYPTSKEGWLQMARELSRPVEEHENLRLSQNFRYSSDTYSVTPNLLEYKQNTYITYPYVKIPSDAEKEKLVNETVAEMILFRRGMLSPFFYPNEFSSLKTSDDILTYLEYEITYSSTEILSFRFWGCDRDNDYYFKEHFMDVGIIDLVKDYGVDSIIMPALTIDLNTCKALSITDIVIFDDAFKEQIVSGNYRNFFVYCPSTEPDINTFGDTDYTEGYYETFFENVETDLFFREHFAEAGEKYHSYGIFGADYSCCAVSDKYIYIIYNMRGRNNTYKFIVVDLEDIKDKLIDFRV
jgi:hypothetical protein